VVRQQDPAGVSGDDTAPRRRSRRSIDDVEKTQTKPDSGKAKVALEAIKDQRP
jgi:hypothetical protein